MEEQKRMKSIGKKNFCVMFIKIFMNPNLNFFLKKTIIIEDS